MMLKVLDFKKTANAATIQLNSSTGKVPAYEFDDRMVVAGLAVKFPTGTKIWHGHAIIQKDNQRVVGVHSDGQHRPLRPTERLEVVGFYDKVVDEDRGKYRQSRKTAK